MGEALRVSNLEAYPEAWVTTDVAADLLGVNSRTMLRRLDQYQTRMVPRAGRGGERYEVLVGSLPADAIARWEACQSLADARVQDAGGETYQAYQRADQRARQYFDRWGQVLLATKEIHGRKALEAWCAVWNRENPDHQVSVQSLYRVRARVAEQGIESLLWQETKLPESTVRDDWFEAFQLVYMQQGKPTLNEAWRKAFAFASHEAAKNGEDLDPDRFPSPAAFRRRLERTHSKVAIAFHRDGPKKDYDRHGISIQRDYSALVAGRIWVGDSRILDVQVRDKDGNIFKPWVTAFVCMKSYMPIGWHYHASSPSAENTMRALRNGIVEYGKPDELYLDNGRENRNNEVTGSSRGKHVNYSQQHTGSLAAILGIKVHFAKPYNARAKAMIERNTFLEMKNKFDRYWMTFCGGNTQEKPERLKGVVKDPADVPTFEEVGEALNEWMRRDLPSIQCAGVTHRGRSRAQVLLDDYKVHGPLDQVSSDTASMLVTKMVRARISKHGVRVSSLDSTWYADWMPLSTELSVVLRYDPDDLRTAWCYKATETGHGPLLGTCTLVKAVGAMVREDDLVGRAQIVEGMQRQRRRIKALQAVVPGITAADLERIRGWHKPEPTEIPRGNVVALTPHDATASHVRREARSGRADLSAYLDQQPEPKTPPRELTWMENQLSAAG